jgi:AcrR family transcriptional regulator
MTGPDKKTALVKRRTEQILASAKRIFAQDGFRRTQLDHIAADLNVGKGTIYRYFKDKKSLFLAVFEQGIALLRRTMEENVESITDPRKKIAAAVENYFKFFDNDRQLIELMMQVRSEFKDDYRRIFLEVYSDYIVKIQETIRAGIKTGVFRNLDVEKTSEAISASLHGVLQDFYVREFGPDGGIAKKELLTDKIDAVTSLLMEGLLERGNK